MSLSFHKFQQEFANQHDMSNELIERYISEKKDMVVGDQKTYPFDWWNRHDGNFPREGHEGTRTLGSVSSSVGLGTFVGCESCSNARWGAGVVGLGCLGWLGWLGCSMFCYHYLLLVLLSGYKGCKLNKQKGLETCFFVIQCNNATTWDSLIVCELQAPVATSVWRSPVAEKATWT